jgi:hypothetical protein
VAGKGEVIASGLLLLLPFYGAGERADFLILEAPASLEILSRYEQTLTPSEKKAIPPFAPLKVVGEKTVLGDGVTPAMEVDFAGNAYYLPRNGWAEKPPATYRHRGCQVEDGQEKQAGAALPCSRGSAPGGKSVTLRAGDALQPVFTCGTHSYVRYVKKAGLKAEYLWCPAKGPYTAKAKATATADTGLSPDMQSLLGSRMEAANAAYAELIQAFNRLHGEARKPPRWDCTFSRDGMRCRLDGGLGTDDLDRSTAVLVQELRNSLTGKPFDVALEKGGIDISPRAEKGARRP